MSKIRMFEIDKIKTVVKIREFTVWPLCSFCFISCDSKANAQFGSESERNKVFFRLKINFTKVLKDMHNIFWEWRDFLPMVFENSYINKWKQSFFSEIYVIYYWHLIIIKIRDTCTVSKWWSTMDHSIGSWKISTEL